MNLLNNGNEKKQIVFTFTANSKSPFVMMLSIASRSARISMPDAWQILLTDPSSKFFLSKNYRSIISLFEEIVVADPPTRDAAWASRWLRTRMREIVTGDFLHLDADVVVRKDLSELWMTRADIAAVRDANVADTSIRPWQLERFRSLSWTLPAHGMINAGVVFWRDSELAHRFGATWHQRWTEAFERTGKHFDQQAFNKAIDESDVTFQFASNKFNAQGFFGPQFFIDAHVWHFFSNHIYGAHKNTYWAKAIFSEATSEEDLSWIYRDHPFIAKDPISAFVIDRVVMSPSRTHPSRNWEKALLRGNRQEAIKDWVKDRFRWIKNASQRIGHGF